MELLYRDQHYSLDARNQGLLIESAPHMREWAGVECKPKSLGGMEEWAKTHGAKAHDQVGACDWYHGTWQYLRLLNMVAVPPWYAFYQDALTAVLRKRPHAKVLVAAAADYGMLATLHEAVQSAGATPAISVYDICRTPLKSCQWYADRHGFSITCACDNIITSPNIPHGAFDLIVTDEFLTVIKAEDKPKIVEKWRALLKPGGTVVTTAMIGEPTTPARRQSYADRARRLLREDARNFARAGISLEELASRFDSFAKFHTRHMLTGETEIRNLFARFELTLTCTSTPGECVNPTNSFQIVASIT